MSLDVHLLKCVKTEIFSANITHNLVEMAREAELYECIWHPENLGIAHAGELIQPLLRGVETLKKDPDRFRSFEPANKWGSYDTFVEWVDKYITACLADPDAEVVVSR